MRNLFLMLLCFASLPAASMDHEVIPMENPAARDDVVIPMDVEAATHHSPFTVDSEQDRLHWERLLFLATLQNDPSINPFTPEQQNMFQIELAKKTRITNYIYATIVIGFFANATGYLALIALLNDLAGKILIGTIIPTALILSVLFTIYGIGIQPHATGVYDGLTLTLHELVLEELNFLASFLVRKAFSKNQQDIQNVKFVIANMDLNNVRAAYARQGNAQPNEVSSLTRDLEEALIYLKENRIIDSSTAVGDEIRLCLLEQRLAELINNPREGR